MVVHQVPVAASGLDAVAPPEEQATTMAVDEEEALSAYVSGFFFGKCQE